MEDRYSLGTFCENGWGGDPHQKLGGFNLKMVDASSFEEAASLLNVRIVKESLPSRMWRHCGVQVEPLPESRKEIDSMVREELARTLHDPNLLSKDVSISPPYVLILLRFREAQASKSTNN